MTMRTHPETARTAKVRPSVTARRIGYLVAIVVNALLLWAVNRWPGWDVVPFLTAETDQVVGWVNASLGVGIAVNVAYLLRAPWWLKALGDLLTTGVGGAALIRLWQVFPVDFDDAGFDWALLTRILLALGIVGSAIGALVAITTLVRGQQDGT